MMPQNPLQHPWESFPKQLIKFELTNPLIFSIIPFVAQEILNNMPHSGFGNFATKTQSFLEKTGRFIFVPLYTHKRKSDSEGKHLKWTKEQHVVLNTLAILTDVGFNSSVIALAITGNFLGALLLKSVHNIGANTVPQAFTDLKNKIIPPYRN